MRYPRSHQRSPTHRNRPRNPQCRCIFCSPRCKRYRGIGIGPRRKQKATCAFAQQWPLLVQRVCEKPLLLHHHHLLPVQTRTHRIQCSWLVVVVADDIEREHRNVTWNGMYSMWNGRDCVALGCNGKWNGNAAVAGKMSGKRSECEEQQNQLWVCL